MLTLSPTAQHCHLLREVNKLNWNRERVTLEESLQQPVPLSALNLSCFSCCFPGSPEPEKDLYRTQIFTGEPSAVSTVQGAARDAHKGFDKHPFSTISI